MNMDVVSKNPPKISTWVSSLGSVAWMAWMSSGAVVVGMILSADNGYAIAAVWFGIALVVLVVVALILDHLRTLDDLERGEALGLEASWERVQGTERWEPGLYVAWDGRSVDEHADQAIAMVSAPSIPSARTTEEQGSLEPATDEDYWGFPPTSKGVNPL